jgi:flagellar basal body-associated protein FliL
MDKKKLLIALVVVLVGGYAGYSIAKPKPVNHDKIAGSIVVLPKAFTLNLADGRYATLTVGLVLAPGQSSGAGGAEAAPPPEGFSGLPEEAAVRDIITNVVTDQPGSSLISDSGRARIKHLILSGIAAHTDVKVKEVLFTDVAVQ